MLCAAPGRRGHGRRPAALDRVTNGRGADHVFLAAGGSSNGPVETAAKLARDRARVVDIGKTKLDLPWNAYYDKELDVRFSRSYGPGRYDDRYELEGIDYPAGYVRWTERRNLECFLDLHRPRGHRGRVAGLRRLPDGARPATVYADLSSGALKAVGVLLEYPAPDPGPQPRPVRASSLVRVGPARPRRGRTRRRQRHGSSRSASSAPATTLPRCCCRTWPSCRTRHLSHVATTKSLSAVNAQRRFGFTTASTSAERCSRTSRWTRSSS